MNGRVIATTADLYGPSSGLTFRDAAMQGTSGLQTTPTQATPVTQVLPQLQASFLAAPITWLVGLIFVLVGYKLVEEHRGGRESFEEIKIGLNNVVKIGLIAMLFFVIARFLTKRYNVPGFSPFVQYATGG